LEVEGPAITTPLAAPPSLEPLGPILARMPALEMGVWLVIHVFMLIVWRGASKALIDDVRDRESRRTKRFVRLSLPAMSKLYYY